MEKDSIIKRRGSIPLLNKNRLTVRNTQCTLAANDRIECMRRLSNQVLKTYDKDMEEMKTNYAKLLVERPQTMQKFSKPSITSKPFELQHLKSTVLSEGPRVLNGYQTMLDKALPPVGYQSIASRMRTKPRAVTLSYQSKSTLPLKTARHRPTQHTASSSSKRVTRSKTFSNVLTKEETKPIKDPPKKAKLRAKTTQNITTCVMIEPPPPSPVRTRTRTYSMFQVSTTELVHKISLSESGGSEPEKQRPHFSAYQECGEEMVKESFLDYIDETTSDSPVISANQDNGGSTFLTANDTLDVNEHGSLTTVPPLDSSLAPDPSALESLTLAVKELGEECPYKDLLKQN